MSRYKEDQKYLSQNPNFGTIAYPTHPRIAYSGICGGVIRGPISRHDVENYKIKFVMQGERISRMTQSHFSEGNFAYNTVWSNFHNEDIDIPVEWAVLGVSITEALGIYKDVPSNWREHQISGGRIFKNK